MPDVSVVVPAYNAAAFLPAALDSILAQTHKDLEIIVVDDGSKDDTEAVLGRYGEAIRVLRQANSGVSVARNNGIAQARGRYVSFLDADDTWKPDKLERQMHALRAFPTRRVCYSAFLVVDRNLRSLTVRRDRARESTLEALLAQGNVVGSICTVICERALFAEVGGFDPSLSQCADWDMWVRLATRTAFAYIDEPLVTYRQHESNMSRDAALLEKDSVRVLDKAFALPTLPSSMRERRRAAYGRNARVLAGCYFQARRFTDFLRCAGTAVQLDPRQVFYLAAFPLRLASRRWRALAPERP